VSVVVVVFALFVRSLSLTMGFAPFLVGSQSVDGVLTVARSNLDNTSLASCLPLPVSALSFSTGYEPLSIFLRPPTTLAESFAVVRS
jgi:hypothetical protein